MRIVEYIMAVILLLAVMVASLALFLFSVGLLEFDLGVDFLTLVHGEFLTALVGGVLFILALIMIRPLFLGRQGTNTVIQNTDFGEVRVAIHAVDSLVQSVASTIDGVYRVSTDIVPGQEGVEVLLKIGVEAGYVVPELAGRIQERVADYIETRLGLSVSGIKIAIQGIRQEPISEEVAGEDEEPEAEVEPGTGENGDDAEASAKADEAVAEDDEGERQDANETGRGVSAEREADGVDRKDEGEPSGGSCGPETGMETEQDIDSEEERGAGGHEQRGVQ